MKTLIVYSSKYGGTGQLAQELSKKIANSVDIDNLADNKAPELDQYDAILIGTSVYAGRARKAVRKFCEKNLSILLKKKTGIFISCWFEDNLDNYVEKSFPDQLVKQSKIVSAGIIADPSEMSILDRFVVKTIAKLKEPVAKIKHDNLEELAASIEE